jgi:hypothetical protein
VNLEAFELVLLRRPGNAPDYDEAELERIQQEHLAHHARRAIMLDRLETLMPAYA